jgi:hypothetical protein
MVALAGGSDGPGAWLLGGVEGEADAAIDDAAGG